MSFKQNKIDLGIERAREGLKRTWMKRNGGVERKHFNSFYGILKTEFQMQEWGVIYEAQESWNKW